MVLQVLLLMPIRTIMNYQYRHGSSLTVATKILYVDGGVGRYYQGMGAALFQGTERPLSICDMSNQTSMCRAHRSLRRYRSQCWHIGIASIKWISQAIAIAGSDHLRVSLCSCFQDAPHTN